MKRWRKKHQKKGQKRVTACRNCRRQHIKKVELTSHLIGDDNAEKESRFPPRTRMTGCEMMYDSCYGRSLLFLNSPLQIHSVFCEIEPDVQFSNCFHAS